ncbi:hypothetical protein HETIRDRAFT_456219 [Heterobasidion irregulare TC 32-1]|uniref:Uncharacterized protein n=1 Tax=Heterobasidion irregulare (strain TC 32-1) TaxID=747525 RepID=W4JMF5_HETIT|nr:uncharacterized protein HETIRDRAFT_456219 [Heterobasidion irregulare TC 32-1]ETW74649.1 hypothetical protein HETIRDRAFT_456219 [Heterobasidion irregulare TC 32-1]
MSRGPTPVHALMTSSRRRGGPTFTAQRGHQLIMKFWASHPRPTPARTFMMSTSSEYHLSFSISYRDQKRAPS